MIKANLTPRSSPRQKRSRERVDLILSTTEQLVLQFGHSAVTTQMISEATNISPGVLYHYFSGKYGIFAAVVKRAFIKLEKCMFEIYQNPSSKTPPSEFIDQVCNKLVDFWLDNRAPMLMWHSLEYDPHMDEVTRSAKESAIKRNSTIVEVYLPSLSKVDINIKAIVMEEISLGLLRQTLFLKPRDRNILIGELKKILTTLLEDV